MTKQDLSKTPHLTRWFSALASLSQSQSVWGSFKWCTKKVEPTLAECKKETKDHKTSKDQGGKKDKKETKKKDDKPKEKNDKEEQDRLKMEKAEAELKEHNDKIKVWLDQEIKFDFEEFKRVYCNAQPGEFPQVFEWLWKNWNDSEVSFFYLRYQKLKNELTGEIKSMNTQQAFIDRTDSKSSRFGFGI